MIATRQPTDVGQPLPPGATRVQLGPVERWVIASGAFILLAIGSWFANQTWSRLDKLGEQQNELARSQAVANAQLTNVTLLLSEIPALRSDTAQLKTDVAMLKAQVAAETVIRTDRERQK